MNWTIVGAGAWLIHWVTFGTNICIHGLGFCIAPIGVSPNSWGCIQVCCIFHPCGGYHCHWVEIASCKWLGEPTTTCGRTTWTFCFSKVLRNGIGFCTFIADEPTTCSVVSTLTTSWTNSKSSFVPDYTPTPI